MIITCDKNPYVAAKLPNMKPRCECSVLDSHEICGFCHQVKYLFNYKANKFCLKLIPESIYENIVMPFQCFKSMPGCEPFFVWNKDLNRFEIYLDNPFEPYTIKQTD